MFKLDKAEDWLFINIDKFFRGPGINSSTESDDNSHYSNPLNTNYMEWELNQDILDIALCDFVHSFRLFVPCFIRKFAYRFQQLALLYLYTDQVENEISSKWHDIGWTGVINEDPFKINVITGHKVNKDLTCSKCLFISEWLKNIYKMSWLYRCLGCRKATYHLTGYFSPRIYEVPIAGIKYLIAAFDRAKLNPAFAFHKRI